MVNRILRVYTRYYVTHTNTPFQLPESVVFTPRYTFRFGRSLIGTKGNLMCMLIMQADLIKQWFFYGFMEDEKTVDTHTPPTRVEKLGQVSVDLIPITVIFAVK